MQYNIQYNQLNKIDRSHISRTFNSHFFEFMDDILSIFPECNEIQAARNSFKTFQQLNPTSIIKAWYQFIYCPYRNEIILGNVDFFVNKDYSGDISGKTKNVDKIMEKIENVRRQVSTMDAQNKAHTARYILNLSRLSEVYHQ